MAGLDGIWPGLAFGSINKIEVYGHPRDITPVVVDIEDQTSKPQVFNTEVAQGKAEPNHMHLVYQWPSSNTWLWAGRLHMGWQMCVSMLCTQQASVLVIGMPSSAPCRSFRLLEADSILWLIIMVMGDVLSIEVTIRGFQLWVARSILPNCHTTLWTV